MNKNNEQTYFQPHDSKAGCFCGGAFEVQQEYRAVYHA